MSSSNTFINIFCFFFFSSRRRHTRCLSDWSSDVCSSDLLNGDRDSGLLELLLTTPLTTRQIVDGYLNFLKRIFFWPIATLLAVEVLITAAEIGRASCRERV